MNGTSPHLRSTSPTPRPGIDGEPTRSDPLRRGIHGLLTLYLLPAVLAVLVVGGLLVVLENLARRMGGTGDGRPGGLTSSRNRLPAEAQGELRHDRGLAAASGERSN
jgi:hypothetical protein